MFAFIDTHGLSDLKIDPNSISWNPDPLRSDIPITLTCLVANQGNGDALNPVLRMFKRTPTTGSVEIASMNLDTPLEAGGHQVVDLVWQNPNLESQFDIIVEVTKKDMWCEATTYPWLDKPGFQG